MYGKVLLTNDGSDLATAAAARAGALASAMGSEVLVMRVSRAAGEQVHELTPETWARQIASRGIDVPGEARAEAHPPLSDAVTILRRAGVEEAGSLVVQGEPSDVIVEAATRLQSDLIVMSSHGLSGIRRAVLGSVADHVVRHSEGIPVLLCRPLAEESDGSYRRVLVALDGSELSDALIPHAEQIAAKTGAEVVLVRVTDSLVRIMAMSTPAGYPVPMGVNVDIVEDAIEAQRAAAQEQLDAVAERLRAAGVSSVATHIPQGEPGEAIVETAEEMDCDLVLLASHGRGGLGRVLLGSVTDHVTRHLSSAAALIVPAR